MQTPSALRCHYEDVIMRDFEGLSKTKKHSKYTVHVIQLCKEVEDILGHHLLLDPKKREQLNYLLNFDPRAKLDIDV